MDFSNKGGSLYHRLFAIYLRTSDGTLLRSIGHESKQFETLWPTLQEKIVGASEQNSTEDVLSQLNIAAEGEGSESVNILEQPKSSSRNIVGIAFKSQEDSASIPEFEKFFAKLLISQSTIDAEQASADIESLTQKLTDLFDSHLRFESTEDKWLSEGRTFFADRVRYFVSRNQRLDACLPAFPCKSSNPDKVTGEDPDKGEELALRRLHDFVQEVEKIYKPGARVWIISDGHVFSDCIGVDDSKVDSYAESLKVMNDKISEELGSRDRVCFRSLVDIFDLRSHVDNLPGVIDSLQIPEIDHHIETEHTEDAEVCRRILMAGCAAAPSGLRSRIESNEKSIISLYRGFSRFMFEDLEQHPATDGLSKKKSKKLSSEVAFEMIQRNQAYSNLVEMVFPDHLRLSIHAHNNAGPKFGIQLFDRDVVRATDNLEPDALQAQADDLLHIPTPWHNSVAEIAGDDTLHVVKSKVAEEALESEAYDGGFVEGDLEGGQGAFYSLKDLTGKIVEDPVESRVDDKVTSESAEESGSSVGSSSVASDRSSTEEVSSDTDISSVDEMPAKTEPDVIEEKKAAQGAVEVVPVKEMVAELNTDNNGPQVDKEPVSMSKAIEATIMFTEAELAASG